MTAILLDPATLAPELNPARLSDWQGAIDQARSGLAEGSCRGKGFLGWLKPAELMSDEILEAVEGLAARLREQVEVLVVVGIGGSYLGSKAAIEALAPYADRQRVLFAGQNISASYHQELRERLRGRRFGLNMISKSGTTTEPAIAFRILRELLVAEHGEEAARQWVVATTDPAKGALRKRADAEGLASLLIPGDVGGRFSVLSPVGLLPMAFAGIDLRALRDGAVAASTELFWNSKSLPENPAFAYAAYRNALYRQGKGIEILSSFEPRLASLSEWWKQLFGESEGKDRMGIFPASLSMTTDLHSLGQYVQDGRRQLFETFLWIEDAGGTLTVPDTGDDADGLGYLAGRSLESVNREAWRGTMLAHRDGGVPIMTLSIPRLDARQLGELFFFFELACAMSGLLLGVNPFDQPAVEDYKTNMFALLGKPGFEAAGERARAALTALGSTEGAQQ